MSIYKAVRRYCLECMGWDGSGPQPRKFVRDCWKRECPLNPYRMGKNPFHPMSRAKRVLDNLKKPQKPPDEPLCFDPENDDRPNPRGNGGR